MRQIENLKLRSIRQPGEFNDNKRLLVNFKNKKIKLRLFLSIFILGFLVLVKESKAEIIEAASCSHDNVSSAYNLAFNGDTVSVPAGNCTWSDTLTLNKPITIQGAGVGSTRIIYGSGGSSLINIDPASGEESSFFRVTGIYFENVVFGVGSGSTMDVHVSGKATGFRIDHCTFHNGTEAVRTDGWTNGVIDNNLFANINLSIRLADDADIRNNHPATNSWGRPIQAGSIDSVFVENNTFTTDNTVGCNGLNEYLYHMDAARSTIRYNTFINDCVAGYIDTYVDAHGLPGCDRGTVMSELYNNSFTFYYQSKWMHLRGGSFLVHDNEITASNGTPRILLRNEQSESGSGFYFDSNWPSTDQINNSFFWNNRVNGSIVADIVYIQDEDNSGSFIDEGRDYFLHAPVDIGGKETYGGSAGLSNSRCAGVGTAELMYEGYVFSAPCCTGLGTGTCDMTFSSSGANAYYPYIPYECPHPLTGLTGSCDSSLAGVEGYNVDIYSADFDSDSDVDIFDYNILLANFGTAGDCENQADADGDCDVDIFDYNILLGEFGSGT